jgi:hypothetical protein
MEVTDVLRGEQKIRRRRCIRACSSIKSGPLYILTPAVPVARLSARFVIKDAAPADD